LRPSEGGGVIVLGFTGGFGIVSKVTGGFGIVSKVTGGFGIVSKVTGGSGIVSKVLFDTEMRQNEILNLPEGALAGGLNCWNPLTVAMFPVLPKFARTEVFNGEGLG
jgi:hypothetical protein